MIHHSILKDNGRRYTLKALNDYWKYAGIKYAHMLTSDIHDE